MIEPDPSQWTAVAGDGVWETYAVGFGIPLMITVHAMLWITFCGWFEETDTNES